jgi:hypothetical protein
VLAKGGCLEEDGYGDMNYDILANYFETGRYVARVGIQELGFVSLLPAYGIDGHCIQ